MGYEWDETKRQRNVRRHGLDFLDVLPCFADPQRLIEEDARRDYGERRVRLLLSFTGHTIPVPVAENGQDNRHISPPPGPKSEARRHWRGHHAPSPSRPHQPGR